MEIDYRELLKKYMSKVYDCETYTFVADLAEDISASELSALLDIQQELSAEGKLR